jgi:hypothetical protein
MIRETSIVLHISICHLSKESVDSLETNFELQSGVEDCVYGLWVNVSYFNYPEAKKTGLKDFDNLIELAKKEKYNYLDIDRDGPEYDDLPKYEW